MGKGARTKLDIDSVLTRVVELFLSHPPHTLTFSKVSRFTKVPRSTLYYYFGSNFSNLISEAVKFGMSAFLRLLSLEEEAKAGQKTFRTWSEFQEAQFRSALELTLKYPWAAPTYFRYRSDLGHVGQQAREIEKKYIKAFGDAWSLYQGKKAQEKNLKMAVYFKLGVLYGFSMEQDFWISLGQEKAISEVTKQITQQVTQLLEK